MEPCGEEARRYPPSATAGCQDMVSDTFSSWAMERFKGFNGRAPNLTTIPGNLVTVSKQAKTPNEPEKRSKCYSTIFVSSMKGNILILMSYLLEYVSFSDILLFPARGEKVAQYRDKGLRWTVHGETTVCDRDALSTLLGKVWTDKRKPSPQD